MCQHFVVTSPRFVLKNFILKRKKKLAVDSKLCFLSHRCVLFFVFLSHVFFVFFLFCVSDYVHRTGTAHHVYLQSSLLRDFHHFFFGDLTVWNELIKSHVEATEKNFYDCQLGI